MQKRVMVLIHCTSPHGVHLPSSIRFQADTSYSFCAILPKNYDRQADKAAAICSPVAEHKKVIGLNPFSSIVSCPLAKHFIFSA